MSTAHSHIRRMRRVDGVTTLLSLALAIMPEHLAGVVRSDLIPDICYLVLLT